MLEGTAAQVSEQGLRKNLYQKIVAAFPEGWMSSGQISRDGKPLLLPRICIDVYSLYSERHEEETREGSDG